MPTGAAVVAWIAGAAIFVTSVGVIWTKVLRPIIRAFGAAEEMLPLLRILTAVFKDNPNAFKVLSEIAAQFRSDSGATLKDQMNRLEQAAGENKAAAEVAKEAANQLKIGVEAQRLLDVQDRETMRTLVLMLDRLKIRVADSAATGIRIEEAGKIVAEDLAAAHKRADETHSDAPAGAAADAAVKEL